MWARAAFLVAVVAGLAACTSGGSAVEPSDQTTVGPSIASGATNDPTLVRLTEGEACGDAFFWAATRNGETAVVVRVEARSRSTSVSTSYPLNEEHLGQVAILHGKNLARNFCTDLIVTNWEPTSRQEAVAGSGEILLAPTSRQIGKGCGRTAGSLSLDGLVAEDGTSFAPIRVGSQNIGCIAG